LFDLRLGAIPTHAPPTVLPQRTLLRHLTWSLPSGQALARAMAAPVLSASDLDELASYQLGLQRATPLFYYVLKEAQLMEDDLRLGPVGARIVGEAMLGLLQLDRQAYASVRPNLRASPAVTLWSRRIPHGRLPDICRC